MSWSRALSAALWSGTVASVASTAMLAACGRAERRDASGPINGPSQWIWGRHAAVRRGFSLRYTVTGYLIHHAMSVLWATLFERASHPRNSASPAHILRAAAATSALACLVDYRMVPKRLTPGFERQLSRKSLFATYSVFALALGGAALFMRR